MRALILVGCTLSTVAALVAAEEIAPIVTLLREQPEDDAVLERAVAWAERRSGVAALAEAVEALSGENPTLDAFIAARLWQSAGRGARALDALERALADGGMAPPGAHRMRAELLLEGGWFQRALACVETAPAGAVSDAWIRQLGYRAAAAAAAGDDRRAWKILDSAVEPVDARIAWALAANRPEHAAELLAEADRSADAIPHWLAAGDWQRAHTESQRLAVELSDADALRVARGLGDPAILDAHLGEREDAAAATLRAQFERSMGTRPSPQTSAPPTDPERDEDPDPPATDPQQERARSILAQQESGTEVDPEQVAALSAGGHRPSLVVALALLEAGARDAARRELTRWRLQPLAEERAVWLPRLARRAPEWFPGRDPEPAVLLARLERAHPEGHARTTLRAFLDRALDRAEPGSEREAVWLFHRGRLFAEGRDRDLERARAIAPFALVGTRRDRIRSLRTLGWHVDFMQHRPSPLVVVDTPSPVDRVLGQSGDRILRQRQDGVPVTRRPEELAVSEWRDDPDPARFQPADLDWDGQRLTRAGQELWRATALTPVHTILDLGAGQYLLVGRGMVIVAPIVTPDGDTGKLREVLRVETTDEIPFTSLAGRHPAGQWLDALPEQVQAYLRRFRAPKIPTWPAVEQFLAGVQRRHRDPGVTIESFLHADDGWIVRSSHGERAHLRRVSGAHAVERPRIPHYDWRVDRYVRRAVHIRPLNPATHLGPHPEHVERAWQQRVTAPSRERPWLRPAHPDRLHERAIPDGLAAGSVLVQRGVDPEVHVTTSGHVLYYRGDDPLPLWIQQVKPPLPGPQGFPALPTPLPGHPGERGPHRAGPIADARAPVVFLVNGEVYVCTDRVVHFDADGARRDVPLAESVTEIVDLAVTDDDEVWVAAGDGRLVSSERVVRPDADGVFDLEVLDSQLFALGYDRHSGFWLERVLLESGGTRACEIPPISVDGDREGLRYTALGRWGDSLLLVHEDLHALDPGKAALVWQRLIDWDPPPQTVPFYQQAPPHVDGDTLIITRPWGVVEGWRKAQR